MEFWVHWIGNMSGCYWSVKIYRGQTATLNLKLILMFLSNFNKWRAHLLNFRTFREHLWTDWPWVECERSIGLRFPGWWGRYTCSPGGRYAWRRAPSSSSRSPPKSCGKNLNSKWIKVDVRRGRKERPLPIGLAFGKKLQKNMLAFPPLAFAPTVWEILDLPLGYSFVDPGGARDAPPGVQLLSFSCTFQQKTCKIIPVWEWDPPLHTISHRSAYLLT